MNRFSKTLYGGVAVAALVLALGGCSGSMDNAEPVFDAGQGDLMSGTIDPIERGKTYFKSGHYGLALESFSAALAREPGSLTALNGVAATYDMLGRYDLADRYYDRALAIAPQSVDLLNNLGYSYILRGDAKSAEQYLSQAAALDVGNAQVQTNLALVDQLARAVAEAPAEVAAIEALATKADSDDGAHLVRLAKGVQVLVTTPGGIPEELAIAAFEPAEADGENLSGAETLDEGVEFETAEAEPAPAQAPALDQAVEQEVAGNDAIGVYEPVAALDQIEASEQPVEVAESAADPVAEVLNAEIATAPAESSALSEPAAIPSEIASADNVAPIALGSAKIEVSNGTGRTGMAYRMRDYLTKSGVTVARVTNAETYDHGRTYIVTRPEAIADAERLAAQLPVNVPITVHTDIWPDIRLVIGRDLHEFDETIDRELVALLLVL